MTTVRAWGVALSAATAATLVLSGCGTTRVPQPTAHATAHGVTLTVTLLPASNGLRELQATFRPQQPGFHIYSIDLPAHGIDGLGIPTRLSVQGSLTAVAKPTANLATRLLRPAGLQSEIPVYPNGSVTFSLPVRQTSGKQADVIVSYGACSENTCLIPVKHKVIHLNLNY